MVRFIKNKLISRKIRKITSGYFEPSEKFLAKARYEFIDALSKKYGVKLAASSPAVPYRIFKYSFGALIMIIFSATGLIAYADKQNVAPNNPLYGFKRLSENVKIQLAPQAEKAVLHEEFAKRRYEEIQAVKSQNVPNQQQAISLLNDFKSEVKDVETNIEQNGNASNHLSEICQMETKVRDENNGILDDSKEINNFEKRCQNNLQSQTPADTFIQNANVDNSNVNGSSTDNQNIGSGEKNHAGHGKNISPDSQPENKSSKYDNFMNFNLINSIIPVNNYIKGANTNSINASGNNDSINNPIGKGSADNKPENDNQDTPTQNSTSTDNNRNGSFITLPRLGENNNYSGRYVKNNSEAD